MNKEEAKQKYKNGEIQICYNKGGNRSLLAFIANKNLGCNYRYYRFDKFSDSPFVDLPIINISEITEAENYDYINPNHYKQGSKEVIDMMVDIWGKEAVASHCEITAFKYRMRLGNKPDQPIERDFEKALWYENKSKELRSCR